MLHFVWGNLSRQQIVTNYLAISRSSRLAPRSLLAKALLQSTDCFKIFELCITHKEISFSLISSLAVFLSECSNSTISLKNLGKKVSAHNRYQIMYGHRLEWLTSELFHCGKT